MKAVETARHNEPWRIEFNTLREMKEEQKADDDEYYGKIIEQKNAELERLRAEIEALKARCRKE